MAGTSSKVRRPKIESLSSFTESINGLVYSDPGTGKTVLGGTTPDALIIATEGGTISAKRHGSTADVARPATWNEFYELVRWGKNDGDPDHKWWVIDTLTEAQSMLMTQLLVDGKAQRASRDLDKPELQDWGIYQNRFKRVVKALNSMPMNILYLAHSMADEDEEGEPIVLPAIGGKNGTNDPTTMSKWVCGTQEFYGHLKVRKVEGKEVRRLILKRSGPYFGKDRYGIAGRNGYIDKPNMADIYERIIAAQNNGKGNNA